MTPDHFTRIDLVRIAHVIRLVVNGAQLNELTRQLFKFFTIFRVNVGIFVLQLCGYDTICYVELMCALRKHSVDLWTESAVSLLIQSTHKHLVRLAKRTRELMHFHIVCAPSYAFKSVATIKKRLNFWCLRIL